MPLGPYFSFIFSLRVSPRREFESFEVKRENLKFGKLQIKHTHVRAQKKKNNILWKINSKKRMKRQLNKIIAQI